MIFFKLVVGTFLQGVGGGGGGWGEAGNSHQNWNRRNCRISNRCNMLNNIFSWFNNADRASFLFIV